MSLYVLGSGFAFHDPSIARSKSTTGGAQLCSGYHCPPIVQTLIAPRLQHDIDGLLKACMSLIEREAEGLELLRVEAATRAQSTRPLERISRSAISSANRKG